MFNYPLKVVQICLRNLANASLPAYKRKLLIALLVLATTEVSFPFRSSPTRDMALQNTQVNSTTYLNPKNISCLDISNKRTLILFLSHRAFTKYDCYPHYLITYIPKKIIMPKIAAHLIYSRRRKGDTFFSQALAKLCPITPQGPPDGALEKFNYASQKDSVDLTSIQYLNLSLSALVFLVGLNLIIKKSKINTNQVRIVMLVENLEPSLLLKRGLFLLPSKGTPNNSRRGRDTQQSFMLRCRYVGVSMSIENSRKKEVKK